MTHVDEKKNGTRRFRERNAASLVFFLSFLFSFFFLNSRLFAQSIDDRTRRFFQTVRGLTVAYRGPIGQSVNFSFARVIVPRSKLSRRISASEVVSFSFSHPFPLHPLDISVSLFLHCFESFVDLPLVFFSFFFPLLSRQSWTSKKKKKKRKKEKKKYGA